LKKKRKKKGKHRGATGEKKALKAIHVELQREPVDIILKKRTKESIGEEKKGACRVKTSPG